MSKKASAIILKGGATLGLQMMTGLPCDNMEKCLYTARRFIELGAKESRIYPTVVLRGTKLAKMYECGEYMPQGVEKAVDISARVYRLFKENEITVLRIGLPDSSELKENYIAGAYHPALGELVISRDIRNQIEESLCGKKEAQIRVNPKFISKVNGNRRSNIEYFKSKGIKITIVEDSSVEEIEL